MRQLKPVGINLHKLEVEAFLNGATQLRIPIRPQPVALHGCWYWKSRHYKNGAGVNYFHTSEESAVNLLQWCVAAHPVRSGQVWFGREPVKRAGAGACWYVYDNEVVYGTDEFTKTRMIAHYKYTQNKLRASQLSLDWSRIVRKCVSVGVERLQDIGEVDLSKSLDWSDYTISANGDPWDVFADVWDKVHGDWSWQQNPWVWVITSEVINCEQK